MKNNDIAMGITYMATNLQAYGESLEVLKHGVGGPLNDERLRERMIEEKKKMSITWKEFRVLAYNLSNNISFSNELLSQQYDENEEITKEEYYINAFSVLKRLSACYAAALY